MFSTDKNIETLAQLLEAVKEYLQTEKLYLRLSISEKVSRILTALIATLVVIILSLILVLFLGTSLAFALAPTLGTPLAFLLTAGIILVAIICLIVFRKNLIEKPLVRLIAGILLNDTK